MIKFPRKRSSKKQKEAKSMSMSKSKSKANNSSSILSRSSVLAGFRPTQAHRKYSGIEDEKKEDSSELKTTLPLNEQPQNHKPAAAAAVITSISTKPTVSTSSQTEERENRITSDHNDDDDECPLFEDTKDDDRSPEPLQQQHQQLQTKTLPLSTAASPIPLLRLPPQSLSPMRRTAPNASRSVGKDAYAIPDRHQSQSRPPTEINIDLEAVPPSPMRDPSTAFTQLILQSSKPTTTEAGLEGNFPPMLDLPNAPPASGSNPLARIAVDAGSKQDLQTQLWDAERLIRIILGSSNNSSPKPKQPLQNGSILQAIKTFALMKQELIELRKQRESSDGDPPAILTNLTSPATTRNTNSMTTPMKSKSTHTPSPGPPREVHVGSLWSPESSSDEQSNFRKAVVIAARKCQELEEQLKSANESIEQLQLENDHTATTAKLLREIQDLKAENQALQSIQEPASKTSQAELEGILEKLHATPVHSVSQDERRRIRQYVRDMVDQTEEEKEPANGSQELQAEIASLRKQLAAARIDNSTGCSSGNSIASHDGMGPPSSNNSAIVQQAYRVQLDVQKSRVQELEDANLELQDLLQEATTATCPNCGTGYQDRSLELQDGEVEL